MLALLIQEGFGVGTSLVITQVNDDREHMHITDIRSGCQNIKMQKKSDISSLVE